MSNKFYDSLIKGITGAGSDLLPNEKKLSMLEDCCEWLKELYDERKGRRLLINIDIPNRIIRFALELSYFVEFSPNSPLTSLLECSEKFSVSKSKDYEEDVVLLNFYVSFINDKEA